MSLFNKPVTSLLNQRSSGGGVGGGLPPTTSERIAPGLQTAVRAFGQYVRADNRRRVAWDNQRFLTSSSLAQTRLNYELGRELGRYYPMDGREQLPEENYKKDLGFGVSLMSSDFLDENGKRKAYPDIVDTINDRFFTSRSSSAPTATSLARFELKFREGRLRAGMLARDYDAKRQVGKMAIGMNTAVRTFRENVAMVRGFDPAVFAESVDALTELRNGSGDYVDPVAANVAYFMAINDLLAAGITEAHTDRDNSFALQVLASTPLRDTESLKRATAGLSEKDQKYLASLPRFQNEYKIGDKAPEDIEDYIPWAIRQLDDQSVAALQARSLMAFDAQTGLSRAEIKNRMKGIMEAATIGSGLSRDAGVREGVKNSISEMMKVADRVYPEDLYPLENQQYQAAGLVALELLESRDFLDETPTHLLDSNLRGSVSRVVSKIQEKFPKNQTVLLPLVNIATKEMAKAVEMEKEVRRTNPYHVLQRVDKSIRVMEGRLDKMDYKTPQEKYLLQTQLRGLVKKKSADLQMAPSFMSETDVGLIQNMDKLGDVAGLHVALKQVREKYGEETYFDYIAPQIGAMEGLSSIGQFSALLRNPQLGEMLSQSLLDYKKNLETARTLYPSDSADRAVGTQKYWNELLEGERGVSGWFGSPILDNFDYLQGYVADVTNQSGEGRAKYAGATVEAARAMAVYYLASGADTDGARAMERATKTLVDGIGRPVEFSGRRTLAPPQYTFNEIQNEAMSSLLRNVGFLRTEILPHVFITPKIQNFADQTGQTPPDALLSSFISESKTDWHFSENGIYPVIPPSATLEGAIPILDTKGQPLVVPYDTLRTYLVNY